MLGLWSARILIVVWALCIVPAAFAALMPVMMFDAPGSQQSPFTWLVFVSVATAPVILLVAVVGGFATAFRRASGNRYQLTWLFAALPFLSIVMIFLSVWLLDTYCGGKFVCP